jgi:polysaccharide pyruvyl transferase WcaK-like protein
MKGLFGDTLNSVIYNRNPQIRAIYGRRRLQADHLLRVITGRGLIPDFLDNSVKDGMDVSFVDGVIFAGTPEWSGSRLSSLYKLIDKHNLPCCFLGIGAHDVPNLAYIDPLQQSVLRHAHCITVRDQTCYEALKHIGAEMVPCPALLSSSIERAVDRVVSIGLIHASALGPQYNIVAKPVYEYLMKLYKEIIQKYQRQLRIEIVAHYIDEMPDAYRTYPQSVIRYSYDSAEYTDIYSRYDIVIGARVHGVGMAASLGIPGILIAHDGRSATAEGFLAETVQAGAEISHVLKLIDKIVEEISERSCRLKYHKADVWTKYMDLLEGFKNKCQLKVTRES